MAWTDIQKVKMEVADLDQAFPLLAYDTYEYLLDKNSGSISRTAIDAARIILLQLAQRTDETVDIFSLKGSKAAESYRLALTMFLKDPTLNPVLQNCKGWVGGISKSEMLANEQDSDLNSVISPGQTIPMQVPSYNYFGI